MTTNEKVLAGLHMLIGALIMLLVWWAWPEPQHALGLISTDTVIRTQKIYIHDSAHTQVTTRLIPVAVPAATINNARGVATGGPAACPTFDLRVTVPDDSADGYYNLTLLGINCASQAIAKTLISHSRVTATATDTATYIAHTHASIDTAYDHAAQHEFILYKPFCAVTAHVLYPLLRSSTDTRLAITAQTFIGNTLALGIRPEAPLLRPLDFSAWKVDLDVGIVLFSR